MIKLDDNFLIVGDSYGFILRRYDEGNMSRVVGCFPNLDCALEEYFKQVAIHAVGGYRTETTLKEAVEKIEKARKLIVKSSYR